MSHLLLLLLVTVLAASFAGELWLELLNLRHSRKPLPAGLEDVYEESDYRKSMQYETEKARFGLFSMAFSFLLLLGMLLLEGFAYFDQLARLLSSEPRTVSLLFFALLVLAADIINLPFSLYSTFVLEERYGFNKTTVSTFFADKLKAYLLGGAIGGMLLYLFILFYEWAGSSFWIYTWLTFSVFSLLMSMFYASLIVPLFNKLTPLPEGELRTSIEAYCRKNDFTPDNLFVMDGSKRSARANAFFSGLGRKKRIVLYDTLVNSHTTEEIVAVLAHEIGHYKLKHTRTTLVLSLAQMGLMLYLMSWFIGNSEFSYVLGASQPSFHLNLLCFAMLYSPVSEATGLLMNYVSRRHEYEADRYASTTYKGEMLLQALKKLSANNLTNLNPHPAYVFVHYSHPTLLQRMNRLRRGLRGDS
jgi:STE24 endopeptidase